MLKNIIFILICVLGITYAYNKITSKKTTETVIPVLKVGISADYPPFEYIQNGKIIGFDVDLAKEITKELGFALQIIEMDFSGLMLSLQQGKLDFVISNISINEKRKQNTDFSIPYYEGSIAAVSLSNMHIVNSDNLYEKAVGVQVGSTMEEFIRERVVSSKINLITLQKVPQLLQELKLGRIDVVLVDQTQVAQIKDKMPEMTAMVLEDTISQYAIAFQKNSALTEKFNQAIQKLKDSGFIASLEEKWLK